MSALLRMTTRGAVLGFAVGLLAAFATNCRPDVALLRATLASLVLAAATLLVCALNQRPPLDDETGGKRNETTS